MAAPGLQQFTSPLWILTDIGQQMAFRVSAFQGSLAKASLKNKEGPFHPQEFKRNSLSERLSNWAQLASGGEAALEAADSQAGLPEAVCARRLAVPGKPTK